MKATAIAVMMGLLLAAAARGQPPEKAPPTAPAERGKVILTWEEFTKITGYDPTKGGPQTLTIPWSQIEDMLGVKVEGLEKAGTTVDLPWQEFKALLLWSIQQKEKDAIPPPTDYIITSSQYAGELKGETATFTLSLKLDVLRKKGWKRIPVLASTVALTKTALPEGVFLNNAGPHYELLTQQSGPMEEVSLSFAVAVTKSAGVNQVSFPRVAAGSSVVDLTVVGREDVDVKVAGAQSLVTTKEKGDTKVAAAIASGVPLTVSWQRALPKVEAAPTKLYAETRTLVAVAEGTLLCRETINLNILHTAVRQLKLTVPAGASVLTVSGRNVEDWRVDKNELLVLLSGEVIGSYGLNVTYEAPGGPAVVAPVLRVVGVEREKGYVAVIALTNVEIAAGAIEGATAMDARGLPADIVAMTNQPILLAFRYVAETFTIPLTIKKHEEVPVLVTIADAGMYTAMQLNDGRRITRVVYSVRNNRSQFLRLKMPAAAEIWSVAVAGNPVAPAKDEQGNVLIPLVRSSRGSRELASFPAELVYVEAPEQAAPSSGTLEVTLPVLTAVPMMHLMYSYYLPAEGTYRMGLFGGVSGFSGPLREVEKFASLSTGPGPEIVKREAGKQVERMQQQVQARVEAEARAAGRTPIRVQLPVEGKLYKLEKILVLPAEKVYFKLQYRDWEPPK